MAKKKISLHRIARRKNKQFSSTETLPPSAKVRQRIKTYQKRKVLQTPVQSSNHRTGANTRHPPVLSDDGITMARLTEGSLVVVFDTETTGLSVHQADIIEVGAVCLLVNEHRQPVSIDETFHSYVNAGCTLSDFISKFTGIAQDQVDHAPLWSTVVDDFTDWINTVRTAKGAQQVYLCGHNILKFDLPMIHGNCARHLKDLPYRIESFFTNIHHLTGLIDTYHMAMSICSSALTSRSLDSLHNFLLGGGVPHAHTAVGDAKATRAVLMHPSMWSNGKHNRIGETPSAYLARSNNQRSKLRLVHATQPTARLSSAGG